MRASLVGVPTNPTVPVGQLQCRCGKTERAKPALFGTDQITDLPSHQRPRSLRMFPDHQFVPDSQLALLLDQDQLQFTDLPDLPRHSFRFRHRSRQSSGNWTALLNLRSWQLEPAFGLQFPQCLQATTSLALSTRVLKPKRLANKIRQFGARKKIFLFQQPTDIFDRLRLRQRALDLLLYVHAAQCERLESFCPAISYG